MTTIVGIRNETQTVIATDTLIVTPGTRIGHTSKMILVDCVTSEGVKYQTCIAVAGMLTGYLALRNVLRDSDYTWETDDDVYANLLAIHQELREHHGLRLIEDDENDAYESSQFQLVVGNRFGLWKVLSCREVIGSEPIVSIGTGREFAIGALTVLGVTDAVANAARAIRIATIHDLATGGEPEVWQSN